MRDVADWGAEILNSVGRPDAIRSWRNQVALTGYRLASFSSADLTHYEGLVVATQHEPSVRSLILAAQAQGLPVVYVPHAPAGNNPQYSDLPTAVAALRGRAEVAHYGDSYGVDPDLLDVVGNPSTDVLGHRLPEISLDSPGVLALSPNPPDLLKRIISSVEEAGVPSLIVAPHPRSDRSMLAEMLPTGWTLSDRPTIDVLRSGAPFMIQHSSGVAWEASALGIPTGKLSLPGERSSYPFLSNDLLYPPLKDASDIRRFIDEAPHADRMELREHATEWCDVDGSASVRRIRALLSAVAAGTRGRRPVRLLDGWQMPQGVSTRASWLPLQDVGSRPV